MQIAVVNSIRDWLNGSRNYDLGAALYRSYGKDPDLMDMFDQGHSDYRNARLIAAMEELYHQTETIEIILPEEPEPVAVAVKTAPMPETAAKPTDDPYREQWMPIFKEMNRLRSRLRMYPTEEERGAAAHQILALEDECQKLWQRRDYYQETGQHMPEEKPASPEPFTDKNAMQHRLLSVRTYVTRYEKKILKQGAKPNLIEKLNQYIAERDALEKTLGYERPINQHSDSLSDTE